MLATRFTCPECDATFRSAQPPPGKKIRCPECDAVIRRPVEDNELPKPASRNRKSNKQDDDFDDRPRKKSKGKKKKQSNNAALIAIPIVAVVLLLVGSAVAYFGFIKKKDDDANNAVAVNRSAGNPNKAQPQPGAKNAAGRPQLNPNAGAVAKNAGPGVQVGNVALEIEGEDLDDKTFKLSDYRGKVVLLDFWGNW